MTERLAIHSQALMRGANRADKCAAGRAGSYLPHRKDSVFDFEGRRDRPPPAWPEPEGIPNMSARQLLRKIEDRKALVGVVGLGYVGLPLVREFIRGKAPVLGFDLRRSADVELPA